MHFSVFLHSLFIRGDEGCASCFRREDLSGLVDYSTSDRGKRLNLTGLSPGDQNQFPANEVGPARPPLGSRRGVSAVNEESRLYR